MQIKHNAVQIGCKLFVFCGIRNKDSKNIYFNHECVELIRDNQAKTLNFTILVIKVI